MATYNMTMPFIASEALRADRSSKDVYELLLLDKHSTAKRYDGRETRDKII
jgi:hypothetical protein